MPSRSTPRLECFCGRTYTDPLDLEEHRGARGHFPSHVCTSSCDHAVLSNSPFELSICSTCCKICLRPDILLDHRIFTGHCFCEDCDLPFPSQEALQSHRDSVIHASEFRCCDCDGSFKDIYALNAHLRSPVHRKPEPLVEATKNTAHRKPQPSVDAAQDTGHRKQPLVKIVNDTAHRKPEPRVEAAKNTIHREAPPPVETTNHTVHWNSQPSVETVRDTIDRKPQPPVEAARDTVVITPNNGPTHNDNRPILRPFANSQPQRASTQHAFPSEIACPLSSTCRMFTSPLGLLAHWESGRCGSGISRQYIERIVQMSDGHYLIHDPAVSHRDTLLGIKKGGPDIPRRCPVCPHQTRFFMTARALRDHLTSSVHRSNLYRCPTDLRTFSTLSGLTQHLRSGTCKGAKQTFVYCIELMQGHFERMGYDEAKLLLEEERR